MKMQLKKGIIKEQSLRLELNREKVSKKFQDMPVILMLRTAADGSNTLFGSLKLKASCRSQSPAGFVYSHKVLCVPVFSCCTNKWFVNYQHHFLTNSASSWEPVWELDKSWFWVNRERTVTADQPATDGGSNLI